MVVTNFTPFPILTTERLILRQLENADDEDIFSHRSDDRVNKYLEDYRHSSIAQTQAFIERIQQGVLQNKNIFWVITLHHTNKFIGTICIWNILTKENKAEIGYTLDPKFHNMGYMSEALATVIEYGFQTMKLKIIEAFTHEDNKASIRILTKNNFMPDFSLDFTNKKNRVGFTLKNEPTFGAPS